MENTTQTTVAEIIAKLQKMPQDAPVYLRAKYSGPIESYTDHPLKSAHGICLMEPNSPQVCFQEEDKLNVNGKGYCVTILF